MRAVDYSTGVQRVSGRRGGPSVSAVESEHDQWSCRVPSVVAFRQRWWDILWWRCQHADQSTRHCEPRQHGAFILPAAVQHIVHSARNSQCSIPEIGMSRKLCNLFRDFVADLLFLCFEFFRFAHSFTHQHSAVVGCTAYRQKLVFCFETNSRPVLQWILFVSDYSFCKLRWLDTMPSWSVHHSAFMLYEAFYCIIVAVCVYCSFASASESLRWWRLSVSECVCSQGVWHSWKSTGVIFPPGDPENLLEICKVSWKFAGWVHVFVVGDSKFLYFTVYQ